MKAPALGIAAAVLAFQVAAGDLPPYSTNQKITPEHQVLAELVAAEWPDLEFSSPLADAAKALAEAVGGNSSPSSASIRQALHDAGLPESTAITATVSTTEEGTDDVLDHLAAVLKSAGMTSHVGLGRAPASRSPFRWQWAILLIDRRINLLEEVPSTHDPATAFPLRFDLRPGWDRPRILVQHPGGRTLRMTPAPRADGWFTVVPVSPKVGKMIVQILAENEVGPSAVAVMPMSVGAAIVESNDLAHAPVGAQLEITDPSDAALFLLETVNTRRAGYGLNRLVWDERLADIATQHSQDMLQNDFLGHRSPSHGNLRQRLTTASYFATVSRENLALDQDLMSAHLSLMASPGHRANVLASDVTHIGIGVVQQMSSEGPPLWIITEIFVRKNPEMQRPKEH